MSNLPETRKAIQLVKLGSPKETLVLNENLSMPVITKPSEILVKVKAAGIETADALVASGMLKLPTLFMKFPCILGMEYSGVIVKVGDHPGEFAVGDEIFGAIESIFGPDGTSTEYIVIDTLVDGIAKKPKHVSFEQAATMGTALAAYKGIIPVGGYDMNDKTTKRKLLIIGASGGLGGYAVQISKIIGAETVGICSGKNAEFVKQLGADRVIDYTDPSSIDELAKNELGSYDMIYDAIGGDDYYHKLKGLLKSKTGIYSSAVGPFSLLRDGDANVVKLAGAIAKTLYRTFFGSERYVFYFGTLPNSKFHVIAEWLDNKELVSTIRDDNSVFELENASDLYDHLLNRKPAGRYVLRIS